MTKAKRVHLIQWRWERYLWLSLASDSRKLARERNDTRWVSPTYRRMLFRSIDQCWSFLQKGSP